MKKFSDETRRRMSESAKARCTPEWRKRMAANATALPRDEVKRLYDAGHTQNEIADIFNTTQKVVWKFMKREGIKARVPAKRDQRGEKNSNWAGDEATYSAFHFRVELVRGKPCLCSVCGETEGRFEWANLTGKYENVNDYVRLCVSCHRRYDAKRRKETGKRTCDHVKRKKKEV